MSGNIALAIWVAAFFVVFLVALLGWTLHVVTRENDDLQERAGELAIENYALRRRRPPQEDAQP